MHVVMGGGSDCNLGICDDLRFENPHPGPHPMGEGEARAHILAVSLRMGEAPALLHLIRRVSAL